MKCETYTPSSSDWKAVQPEEGVSRRLKSHMACRFMAAEWYSEAAEQGHADAAFALGVNPNSQIINSRT